MILDGPTSAFAVAELAKTLMDEADADAVIRRKDTVRGIEVIFSVPAHVPIDRMAYFADAVAWVKTHYGIPVLSAIVHFDESSPHCHVLLLPLRDGKMKGSEIVGGPPSLSALHKKFHEAVSIRYGLRRPEKKPYLSAQTRQKCADLVMTAFQSDVTLIDRPEVIDALNRLVANDPMQIMEALEIAIPYPPKKLKGFVETMIAPANPEPTSKQRVHSRALGDDDERLAANETISCVRFADSDDGLLGRVDSGGIQLGLPGIDDCVETCDPEQLTAMNDDAFDVKLNGTDGLSVSTRIGASNV